MQPQQGPPPPVPQFEAVAKAFTGHYYATFDSNRAALVAMYLDVSMLTFEGVKVRCLCCSAIVRIMRRYWVQGKAAIHAKLTEGIQFRTSRHRIQTLDAQPTPAGGGVVVFVGGEILVDEEERPLRFSQVFVLMPLPGGGSYYIHNDMFRLHYA